MARLRKPTPDDIRRLLTTTAIDMDDPYDRGYQSSAQDPDFATGYDFASGYGFIDTVDAIELLISELGVEQLELSPVGTVGNLRE